MIDHAAEARELLGADTPAEEAVELLMAAQVHATLALADEQRTANLIAVLTTERRTPLESADQATALQGQILARLGLTPTTPNQEQPS